MTSIVGYRKASTAHTLITLALPQQGGQHLGTELCTLGDVTYVAIPTGAEIPRAQPVEIAASIKTIVLDAVLREAIKAASPHVQLIDRRMIDKIRSAYTVDDEMYFARIGVGAANGLYQPTSDEMQALTAFGEFVEGVRQWGRDQRAELGL